MKTPKSLPKSLHTRTSVFKLACYLFDTDLARALRPDGYVDIALDILGYPAMTPDPYMLRDSVAEDFADYVAEVSES